LLSEGWSGQRSEDGGSDVGQGFQLLCPASENMEGEDHGSLGKLQIKNIIKNEITVH